jgi:hypothetical protein
MKRSNNALTGPILLAAWFLACTVPTAAGDASNWLRSACGMPLPTRLSLTAGSICVTMTPYSATMSDSDSTAARPLRKG